MAHRRFRLPTAASLALLAVLLLTVLATRAFGQPEPLQPSYYDTTSISSVAPSDVAPNPAPEGTAQIASTSASQFFGTITSGSIVQEGNELVITLNASAFPGSTNCSVGLQFNDELPEIVTFDSQCQGALTFRHAITKAPGSYKLTVMLNNDNHQGSGSAWIGWMTYANFDIAAPEQPVLPLTVATRPASLVIGQGFWLDTTGVSLPSRYALGVQVQTLQGTATYAAQESQTSVYLAAPAFTGPVTMTARLYIQASDGQFSKVYAEGTVTRTVVNDGEQMPDPSTTYTTACSPTHLYALQDMSCGISTVPTVPNPAKLSLQITFGTQTWVVAPNTPFQVAATGHLSVQPLYNGVAVGSPAAYRVDWYVAMPYIGR